MTVKIQLESNDGECFKVSMKVAKRSKTIETMLEALGMIDEQNKENQAPVKDEEPIPLVNVDSNILKKVIAWCEEHQDAKEAEDKPGIIFLNNWQKKFFDLDHSTVFELIKAANYLNIKDLLDASCQVVADNIKGKTAQEIRETFDIKNDFAPEEEAQIRKENEWVEPEEEKNEKQQQVVVCKQTHPQG